MMKNRYRDGASVNIQVHNIIIHQYKRKSLAYSLMKRKKGRKLCILFIIIFPKGIFSTATALFFYFLS